MKPNYKELILTKDSKYFNWIFAEWFDANGLKSTDFIE